MKYAISEKQLANIILKQQSEDLEYNKVSNAEPEKDEYVMGQDIDEQDDTETSTAATSEVSSPSADEYPAYPETGKWETGIERGSANQIDSRNQWRDTNKVQPDRSVGHANKLV